MAVRNGKSDKKPVLNRVVKFQIHPTLLQFETMQIVSDNLRQVWNECLSWRQDYFNNYLKPLYQSLKEVDDETMESEIRETIKESYKLAPVYHVAGQPERSQASWLTTQRQSLPDFAAIPCGWQQETLKILEGSFKSFAELRHKGDRDARPPRLKDENSFCEIQGCVGWAIQADTFRVPAQKDLLPEVHGHAMANSSQAGVILSPGKSLPGGAELMFAMPEYQRLILSRAVKLSKFTLYRDKKKRYWISVAYAIPKPDQLAMVPENTVFVSLGASHVGIVSEQGEEVVDLWRPDKHWMRVIASAKRRGALPQLQSESALRRSVAGGFVTEATVASARIMAEANTPYSQIPKEERKLFLEPRQKGSAAYNKLWQAVNRAYEIMRLQQLDNQRNVVTRKLRSHGVHFVLIEHSPVRSKRGKLADASKAERSGQLGLNWQAQNTGSLARLRQLLEQKAEEWGGSVSTIKLQHYPSGDVRERKLAAARIAKGQFQDVA